MTEAVSPQAVSEVGAGAASALGRLGGLVRRHGARTALFVANFGLAKSLAFLAPLLLAVMLPAESYGQLEFALAVAAVAAQLASLGITSAVPQLALVGRAVPVIDLLAGHIAIAGVAGGLALAGAILAGASWTLMLAIAATLLTLIQGACASYCRTFSLRNAAVWLDSLKLIASLAIGVALVALGRADTAGLATGFAALALAGAVTAAGLAVSTRSAAFTARAARAMRIGLPLVGYSLVAVWITSSGQILIGAALGGEAVAVYAFCMRIAMLPLALHALVATGLFARIYTMRARVFDRAASIYLAGIGALCLVFTALFPFVIGHIPTRALAGASPAEVQRLFPVLALFVFAWIAGSTVESRINRYRLARPMMLTGLAVAAGVGLAVLVLARTGALSLQTAAGIVAMQSLVMPAAGLAILWRRGLKMPRLAAALTMAAAAMAIAAL